MTTTRRPALPRRRRSGSELRRAILTAARELFGERGFAGTATRDVARQANVSEQSVYSHFGNKQGLYEAAILEPFNCFVGQFISEWSDAVADVDSLEELMVRYVKGLYEVSVANRDLMRALPSGHLDTLASRDLLEAVESWVAPLARGGGYDFDPHVAVRSVFILVTSLAMLGDDLMAGAQSEHVVAEVTRMLLHGLLDG